MMSRGTPSWNEDVSVPILRDGTLEETYWTYGHSPVFDEAGGIGGVLVICTETTERVIAAAKLAGAHDFVLELPEGYDTIVGERGSSLSGGQRQRIAIARALISDPRILIFDEATSALDYESERTVQQNMAQIADGRTVFVIAHRLSALRMADRIITIDRGRLIEDGTHDDLIKIGGRYATLHRLQAGLHEVR